MNHINSGEFDPALLTGVAFFASVIVLSAIAIVWWDKLTGGD